MAYPTTPNGLSDRFLDNQVVERGASQLGLLEVLIVQVLLLGVILEEECLL